MHDSAWTKALLLTPPLMFGRRLLPFSIAHNYLLKVMESPFKIGGTARLGDVLLAVKICSQTWEQNREWLSRRSNFKEDARWSWRWRSVNVSTASDSLQNYMEDFQHVPRHKEIAGDDSEKKKTFDLAAPLEFHLVNFLMKTYGMSVSEAWNTPINMANCLFDTEAESKGDESLMSEYDAVLEQLAIRMNTAAERGDIEAQKAAESEMEAWVYKHKGTR